MFVAYVLVGGAVTAAKLSGKLKMKITCGREGFMQHTRVQVSLSSSMHIANLCTSVSDCILSSLVSRRLHVTLVAAAGCKI